MKGASLAVTVKRSYALAVVRRVFLKQNVEVQYTSNICWKGDLITTKSIKTCLTYKNLLKYCFCKFYGQGYWEVLPRTCSCSMYLSAIAITLSPLLSKHTQITLPCRLIQNCWESWKAWESSEKESKGIKNNEKEWKSLNSDDKWHVQPLPARQELAEKVVCSEYAVLHTAICPSEHTSSAPFRHYLLVQTASTRFLVTRVVGYWHLDRIKSFSGGITVSEKNNKYLAFRSRHSRR